MSADHVHERGPETRTHGRYRCQYCEMVRDGGDWTIREETIAAIEATGQIPRHKERVERMWQYLLGSGMAWSTESVEALVLAYLEPLPKEEE